MLYCNSNCSLTVCCRPTKEYGDDDDDDGDGYTELWARYNPRKFLAAGPSSSNSLPNWNRRSRQ